MSDHKNEKQTKLAPPTKIPHRTRVLTGLKPTGELHLGNFVGGIRPCVEFSARPDFEVILMCADWHGLSDRNHITEPGARTLSVLAALLCLGFKTENNSLILQSDFPQIQENAWYLSCVAAVGLLERAHAYKDAVATGKKPTAGLFYYPVLMASDIITFDAEVVPVGKDQAQHLEYADDLAKLFNNAVGSPVFHGPSPLIQDETLLIGIDGEKKMSKSYNNHIPLFGEKKDVEKRIKSIKTDSLGVDDVKAPATCPVFQILSAFGGEAAVNHMRESLQRGKGYGYGHAKMDLLAEYERVFGAKREEYNHYIAHPNEMWARMKDGFERAESYANSVRIRARQALGLKRFRPSL